MKGWTRKSALLLTAAMIATFGFSAEAADDDAPSADVTFTRDVLPILQQNCQTCHRPGGDNYTGMVAPMSLMTYEETRPWAKSIAKEVGERTMPPWHASGEFKGVFSNERSLTDAQIQTIQKWVATGARHGRPEDAPAPVVFPDFNGWRIGEPDLIVTFEEPYHVADEVEDLYVTISARITEEQLPEDRWVKAIEWKGGSSVVHHIVGSAVPPGAATRAQGGYGLGSIAPGEEPMMFPDGYAKVLLKGSKLIFSMHYHKEPGPGTAVDDISMVAFKFYPKDAKIKHFVDHGAIGNSGFEIPPNHPNWKVGAARTFEEDTTLLALHPHMHLRGKNAKYVAFYPDGTQETLLEVPKWDFNWQTDYSFKVPKKLPAGTRVEYTAHFDNSSDNPANPDPSIPVRFGGPTTDEMMLGYVTSADSEARDLTIEDAIKMMRRSYRR